MGIRLILSGFGGDVRIAAVALDASGIVGRLCGRALRVTGGAIETGGNVLVDQKAVPGAWRGWRLGE